MGQEMFIVKIVKEYNKALDAGVDLNWREVAGKHLAAGNLDLDKATKALESEVVAKKAGPETVDFQALNLLRRIKERQVQGERIMKEKAMKAPAKGEAQVATPAPATAKAG